MDEAHIYRSAVDLPECSGIQIQAGAGVAGQREIGVVQQIEELRPELHAPAFGDGEILEHRPVHVPLAGPAQNTTSRIAVRAGGAG